MPSSVLVTVFVKNRDEAKVFDTDRLGFVVRTDESFGENWRCLTVAPSDDPETVIELAEATTEQERALIGSQANDKPIVMCISDDIAANYRTLSDRGVPFDGESTSIPSGTDVGCTGIDGNQFDLFQPDFAAEEAS